MAETSPWDEFRRLMPIAEQWAYFDHASVAPLSGPAHDALVRYAHQAATAGGTAWAGWQTEVERLRQNAAALIGADPGEIALLQNTTAALGLVAEGFPWQPGDNVVFPGGEFPSNAFPWRHLTRRGVEVREVVPRVGQEPLAALALACDRRTRIVALSWVHFAHGQRLDLAAACELAHRHGAWLVVDAIQGLGVLPLDVGQVPVDCLAADGHKWLLGPEGAAVFYLRREHLERLAPQQVGWNSVAQTGDYSHIEMVFRPAAGRFEGGSLAMGNLLALGASVELLARLTPLRIAERLREITGEAVERLAALGARVVSDRRDERQAGIVAFELPGQDPAAVRRRALRAGVALSVRVGRLRISPHAYANGDDLDRLCEVLAQPSPPETSA